MSTNSILKAALLLGMAAALQACNGILDDIYDQPESDASLTIGFNGTKTRYRLVVNAASYGEWVYIDLHNRRMETITMPDTLNRPEEWDGRSQWTYYDVQPGSYRALRHIPTLPQREAAEWDIAIHHFDVKTNGGAALETVYESIDQAPASSKAFAAADFTPDQWSTNQCIVDFSGMLSHNIWYASSYSNPVLSGWVKMDFTTPPPTYSATRKVYILRLSDGSHAALHLLSYQSDAGTKGILTIDVKYPY